MKTHIISILAGNRIYLPKQVTDYLNLAEGDVLLLRCNDDKKGIVLCKPTLANRLNSSFKDLDDDFVKLDEGFRELYRKLR